jgi:putative transposase
LVVLPREATLLAKDIDQMHFRYTQYFNSKNKRSGHLWQNMFYSVVSKAMHLVCAMWYFERNPAGAGTVQPLKRYL